MPITQWSTVADDNTTVDGINIDEGCPPGNLNDAIRNVMADVKSDYDTPFLNPVREKHQALGTISGATTIDLSAGLSVSATIGEATTLAFTGIPTGGAVVAVLRLTNGGSATVTWPTTIAWANSNAPALTATGIDMIVLATSDGGVSWWGSVSLKYGAGV